MINFAGRQPVVVTKDSLKELFWDRYVDMASAEVFSGPKRGDDEKIVSTLDGVLVREAAKSSIRCAIWKLICYASVAAGTCCYALEQAVQNQKYPVLGAACIGALFVSAAKVFTEMRLESDLDTAVNYGDHEVVMTSARREELLRGAARALNSIPKNSL